MNRVCILPWKGEFGWYCMIYPKTVDQIKADFKVVCCAPGEECLFPSANDFYYYHDTSPDEAKRFDGKMDAEDQAVIQSTVISRYGPDIKFVKVPFRKNPKHFRNQVYISPLKKRNIVTDILIAPRFRYRSMDKNFRYWDYIIREFSRDYRVGLVGKKGLSYDTNIPGIVKSWEVEDTVDCVVDMLLNTKMLLTTSNGIMHLANLCRTVNIAAFSDQAGGPCEGWFENQRSDQAIICFNWKHIWYVPELVLDFARTSLKMCIDKVPAGLYKYKPETGPNFLQF